MKIILKYIVILFFSIFLFSAYASGEQIFYKPRLSIQDILTRAKLYVIEQGISIDLYYTTDISYDYVTHEWRVFYDKDTNELGSDFWVTIDDMNLENIKINLGL